MKLTNTYIQAQVTGRTEKNCWSMLWQRKTLSVSEVMKKGDKENTIRKAFIKFVKEGWATKPKDTRNIIEINKDITK